MQAILAGDDATGPVLHIEVCGCHQSNKAFIFVKTVTMNI